MSVLSRSRVLFSAASALAAALSSRPALCAEGAPPKPPEFPPYQQVIEGYEKVVSTMDGQPSFYTIWVRRKDNEMLAELPPGYEGQKHFIALTVAAGETFAGLQAGSLYAFWKRYGRQLALIEPNVNVRSTGDPESKESVKRLFTGRVVLDVPIVTVAPNGSPVIDMDDFLLARLAPVFGRRTTNPKLATIKTAKAFPKNVELAFEAPVVGESAMSRRGLGAGGGARLRTLHFSVSLMPDDTGYKPRVADSRVGYFTTSYADLGKFKEEEKQVRYINRWRLEKRDPNLKYSEPKDPIVFYIEHTTPSRYRYWVRKGVLAWNEAFERVGIRDAIQVYQQDAVTGAHMEKDPEDVRYNFIRWLNNDVAVAIGPSRVHPLTGEILDADVILTDGWIREYVLQYEDVLPKLAMEGFGPRTLDWLRAHPRWDPSIRLAHPAEQARLAAERTAEVLEPFGGHPAARVDPRLIGDDEYDGLVGSASQLNGMCLAAQGKALDLALLRMTLRAIEADGSIARAEDKPEEPKPEEPKKEEPKKEEPKKEEPKKPDKSQVLDGLPEEFIGPLLADLVTHEVGHTLGLRHNFKASTVYTLEEISSEAMKGKPFAGSVMDYLPINMHVKDGKIVGDYAMAGIGPYDLWAIEYGYSFENDLKPVLARVAERELVYGTDEDTWGPDPRARRYDFSANPIDYARSQMDLAKYHRERLVDAFVKDGESWARARKGYELTLGMQVGALRMMSGWLGGVYVNRDKKGDKGGRAPLEVVPAAKQREALEFLIECGLREESFGLTPKLLRHLTADLWLDEGTSFQDVDWPIHDRLAGIQASVLTMVLNPDTLRRVYDNELRVPAEEDAVTLPEVLDKVTCAVWSELENPPSEGHSARKPWISSLRRNLQKEHLDRLIDLVFAASASTEAYKPISNLAAGKLRDLLEKIAKITEERKAFLDPYSLAHLADARQRISKALDAQYIYNAPGGGGSSGGTIIILQEKKGESAEP